MDKNNIIIGEFIDSINTKIDFLGCNSKIKIGDNVRAYNLRLKLYNNCYIEIGDDCVLRGSFLTHDECTILLGKNVRVNGNMNISSAEKRTVIIGDNCLISSVTIRPSDMHPIYDIETNNRINHPKDIKIGNNCWFGEDVFILKGVTIGNNSVVGAKSVVTKAVPRNVIVAGNPAQIIKTNIYWKHNLNEDKK